MKVAKIIKRMESLEIEGATLPTIEEAALIPPKIRDYRWYWLRSPGLLPGYVADVTYGTNIHDVGSIATNDNHFVRPLLKITNLDVSNFEIGDVFEFGGRQFQILSETMAFCLSDMGECAFSNDASAQNASDYEKSLVKTIVDAWFEFAQKNPPQERLESSKTVEIIIRGGIVEDVLTNDRDMNAAVEIIDIDTDYDQYEALNLLAEKLYHDPEYKSRLWYYPAFE